MSKYEIHKLMRILPSQSGRHTRLEDILTGILLIAVFIFSALIGI